MFVFFFQKKVVFSKKSEYLNQYNRAIFPSCLQRFLAFTKIFYENATVALVL